MTTDDLHFTLDAIKKIGKNYKKWAEDYIYDKNTNEFTHKKAKLKNAVDYKKWFEF